MWRLLLVCGLTMGMAACATRRAPTPAPPPPAPPLPGPVTPGPTPPEPTRPLPPAPPAVEPAPGREGRSVLHTLRIETGPRGSGRVEVIDLEDYVRDVVVGELSVAAGDGPLVRPAYEAQAIVARTYALAVARRHAADGFDLCSSTHCQVYVRDRWRTSRWAGQIDAAVQATRGRYLADGRGPIEAVFHAHCGGGTSAAAEVWRSVGALYLRGVADPYCLREQPAAWTATVDLERLRRALNMRDRTNVGDRLDGLHVLRRDAAGRVVEVALAGTRSPVVTGEDFRLAVLAAAGPASLRSARFDVRRQGTTLHFTGHGSGHGVGLCQIGLIGRLRAGQSPIDVLRTYYPGTTLERR